MNADLRDASDCATSLSVLSSTLGILARGISGVTVAFVDGCREGKDSSSGGTAYDCEDPALA